MNIAYFGFDLFFDCLEALTLTDNKIIKIFTCKVDEDYESSSKTRMLAERYSIPITNNKVSTEDIKELERLGCDVIISAGYYYKIPSSSIIRSVNIHPALLPLGRGPWPMPVSILRGDSCTGVTLHQITESFDAGDIILQQKVDITDRDNLETLTLKLQKTAKKLVITFLKDIEFLWTNKKPQTVGEYWKEPGVNEMTFTSKTDYETVDRITKAFYGYHCYFINGKDKIEIKRAICVKNISDAPRNIKLIPIKGGFLCILNLT